MPEPKLHWPSVFPLYRINMISMRLELKRLTVTCGLMDGFSPASVQVFKSPLYRIMHCCYFYNMF